jgi:DNA-binding MarR family transcriptional regulator
MDIQKEMINMKNENYFVVNGWMRNKLNLKGKELLIYAIIYGFSQVRGTKYNGSLRYLADCIGMSRDTVIRTLKKLEEKKLIIKTQTEINNVTYNNYKAVTPDEVESDEIEEVKNDDLFEILDKVKKI